MYTIHIFTYFQHLLPSWVICGSAEQPLQVPGDRAQSQPKPHPSDKIM